MTNKRKIKNFKRGQKVDTYKDGYWNKIDPGKWLRMFVILKENSVDLHWY